MCLRHWNISVLLGSSVDTVSERKANLRYFDEVAENIFPRGSVWMAGQMGPEMWLYLKAVLSLNVTFAVFENFGVT